MERTLDSNSINNNSFGSSKKSIVTNLKSSHDDRKLTGTGKYKINVQEPEQDEDYYADDYSDDFEDDDDIEDESQTMGSTGQSQKLFKGATP